MCGRRGAVSVGPLGVVEPDNDRSAPGVALDEVGESREGVATNGGRVCGGLDRVLFGCLKLLDAAEPWKQAKEGTPLSRNDRDSPRWVPACDAIHQAVEQMVEGLEGHRLPLVAATAEDDASLGASPGTKPPRDRGLADAGDTAKLSQRTSVGGGFEHPALQERHRGVATDRRLLELLEVREGLAAHIGPEPEAREDGVGLGT